MVARQIKIKNVFFIFFIELSFSMLRLRTSVMERRTLRQVLKKLNYSRFECLRKAETPFFGTIQIYPCSFNFTRLYRVNLNSLLGTRRVPILLRCAFSLFGHTDNTNLRQNLRSSRQCALNAPQMIARPCCSKELW